MGRWMSEEELEELLDSQTLKEHLIRVKELELLLRTVDEKTRVECMREVEVIIKRDEGREGLEEIEFADEQEEETETIANKMPAWFPSLSSRTHEELVDYVHALLSCYLKIRDTH